MIAKWFNGKGFDFEIWVARVLMNSLERSGHYDGKTNKYSETCSGRYNSKNWKGR